MMNLNGKDFVHVNAEFFHLVLSRDLSDSAWSVLWRIQAQNNRK